MISGLFATIILTSIQLRSTKEKSSLKDKLVDYKKIQIINYALIEGPILLSIIAYYMSGNYLFLGLAAIMFCIFLLKRPTKNKTIYDLELSQSETLQINDPNAIIGEVVIDA